MWTNKRHHFDYVQRIFQEQTGESEFWIGLDDRSKANDWENSYGNVVPSPHWTSPPTDSSGNCAKIPGPNGG